MNKNTKEIEPIIDYYDPLFANQEEIWKDIPDFEGRYQISNLGRVKSLVGPGPNRARREKIRKLIVNKYGYLMVSFCVDWREKKFLVHRLLCLAFLPNPYNLTEVNHKNRVRHDCRLSNLEWVSPIGNQKHAWGFPDRAILHPRGERNGSAVLTEENVKEIRAKYNLGVYSHRGLSKEYGVSHCQIGAILRREKWAHVE